MIEQSSFHFHLPENQLQNIATALLSIPKAHKLIHPCQERTKYSQILEWMVASLNQQGSTTSHHQQQLIISGLTEVISLAKKQCLQKGIILEMVLQYFISTIEGLSKHFEQIKQQIRYQFSRNVYTIEKDYEEELKRLREQNEQLNKEKNHRWKNMFMVIKDNRIHRKQNKKLLKDLHMQIDKAKASAQQLLTTQLENQRLKVRVAHLQGLEPQLMQFVQSTLRLNELQRKIRDYPKKTKKMLRSQLEKVSVGQSRGLMERVEFIINAIEQTGQIIDDTYDEDHLLASLKFNISTQTDSFTEDRAVNTIALKTADASSLSKPEDHICLDIEDTVQVKIQQFKKQKKEVGFRQSRAVMLATTNKLIKPSFIKKDDDRSRQTSRRIDLAKGFRICESLKITIAQMRIAYISTYNTEIFNGASIVRQIESKVIQERQQERKTNKKIRVVEVKVQTDEEESPFFSQPSNFGMRARGNTIKSFKKLSNQSDERWKKSCLNQLVQMSQEVYYCYNPSQKLVQKQKVVRKQSQKNIRSSLTKKMSTEKGFDIRKSNQGSKEKDIKISLTKLVDKDKDSFELSDKLLITEVREKNGAQTKTIGKTKRSKQETITQYSSFNTKLEPFINEKKIYCTSEDISAVMSPAQSRSSQVIKPFSNTLQNISNHFHHKSSNKKNQSSIISQSPFTNKIKKVQTNKLSKLKFQEDKVKRFATQNNEPTSLHCLDGQNFLKPMEYGHNTKMKPLHKIAQDVSENDRLFQSIIEKERFTGRKLSTVKDADAGKDLDFGKMVDKIMKNIEVRLQEVARNTYTFRVYLTSFFKCFYGKELFPNFLAFLAKTNSYNDEALLAFSKLLNPKLPEKYSADLFKTFGASICRIYQAGQCPLKSLNNLETLKYMVGQYYAEEQVQLFERRMRKQFCFSFLGWFNCLQAQLRQKVLQSQLYSFLCEIVPESQDSLDYQWVEELYFYANNDANAYQYFLKAKCQLNSKTALHKLCLFCLKTKWHRFLNIDSSVINEYANRIGDFREDRSIRNVEENIRKLDNFKHIQRCLRYRLALHQRYGCGINRTLLMIAQLNMQETIIREQMPISKDLMLINWSFEGLRKKRYYQELRGNV